MTKYHEMSGVNRIVFLTVLESGIPRSRHQRGPFLMRASSWPVEGALLSVCSCNLSLVCARGAAGEMLSSMMSLLITTLIPLDQGATLMTSFDHNYVLTGAISK